MVGRDNEADTFIIDPSNLGKVVILDFEEHDSLQIIQQSHASTQPTVSLDAGGDVLFDFGAGNSLTLVDSYLAPQDEPLETTLLFS